MSSSQSFSFSSSHVWMWGLDHKESWAPNNQCFWIVVLEKTLESPLDCKEIQPVHPKGNQSWIFIGKTDAEAEVPKLWPHDAKSWLTRKDSYSREDWRQEEKWITEDGMVGWHHWFKGNEFEQAPGDGDGQGGLACCSPWGHKESDTTELLNWLNMPLLTRRFESPFLQWRVYYSTQLVRPLHIILVSRWMYFYNLIYTGKATMKWIYFKKGNNIQWKTEYLLSHYSNFV